MEDLPRAFKGVWIPAEIWIHPELNFLERCLWAEINSLDREIEGCTASNDYLCRIFGMKERALQCHLAKLKNLDFIQQESFDGRTRILRSSLKTTYKKLKSTHAEFDTSEVQPPIKENSGVSIHAPLGCRNEHPSPIEREINIDIVCCSEANAPENQSAKITKKGLSGEIVCSLQEIYAQATIQKKNWTMQEISESWKILVNYSGIVGDCFKLIDGTIANLRKKKTSEFLAQGKGNRACQKNEGIFQQNKNPQPPQKSESEQSENSKENSSGRDLRMLPLPRSFFP